MNTEQTEQQTLSISQEKLLAFVRAMLGIHSGREDDEHPLPPGPWDPVIRAALERINVFGLLGRFGPHPEPWRSLVSVFGPSPEPWKLIFASMVAKHPELYDVIGGGQHFNEVALNPQPLPPRFAFLMAVAQTLISRAELLHEMADATRRESEQEGIIIVSGYIARFVDDFCGNGFRFKWPFPGPRPYWLTQEVSEIDLILMAVNFDQAARETHSPLLQQSLADASATLALAALSKMQ